jgi:hypothetical protein
MGRQMNLIKSVFPRLGRWAKVALLPIALAITLSSSPLSAATLSLGNPQVGGTVDATTCFADPCDERSASAAPSGNASVGTPDSAAQTTAVLSRDPSISARSEADALQGGGSVGSNFSAGATANVSLEYHFEIVGPQNISVPVLMMADANVAVTGNLASSAGFEEYNSDAILFIDGNGQTLVDREALLQVSTQGVQNGTRSSGFSVDMTDNLMTNTAYEVSMQVSTGAGVEESSLSNLVSTASIDPSFQIGPGFSDYSIVFSDGIGDTPSATPLPGTLPLFAGGLGMLGFFGRRRKQKALNALAA